MAKSSKPVHSAKLHIAAQPHLSFSEKQKLYSQIETIAAKASEMGFSDEELTKALDKFSKSFSKAPKQPVIDTKELDNLISTRSGEVAHKELNPEVYKKLMDRYKSPDPEKTLYRIDRRTATDRLRKGFGNIGEIENIRGLEPAGIYTVDRTQAKHWPSFFGDGGIDEGEIRNLGEFKEYIKENKQYSKDVYKLYLKPDAKVLNANTPDKWVEVLDQFADHLEAIDHPGARVLKKAVASYTDMGGDLGYAFDREVQYALEDHWGKGDVDALKKRLEGMSKEFTKFLSRNYDAVRFPDIAYGNEAVQTVLLRPGSSLLKKGKVVGTLGLALTMAAGGTGAMALGAGEAQAYTGEELLTGLHTETIEASVPQKQIEYLNRPTLSPTMRPPTDYRLVGVNTAAMVKGFVEGFIPLQAFEATKPYYETLDNAVKKIAKHLNREPNEASKMAGEVGGMITGVGKIFGFMKVGRAWMASQSSLLMKPLLHPNLLNRSLDMAAVGTAYGIGRGEVTNAGEAGETAAIWGGLEAATGVLLPAAASTLGATRRYISSAKYRQHVWDKIVEGFEKGTAKVDTSKWFGGKYGNTLQELLEPASVRLKRSPQLGTVLDEVEKLQADKYAFRKYVEERTMASAKALKDIPKGQELTLKMLGMDPSSQEYITALQHIKNRLGVDAARVIHEQRMLSRKDWTAIGKMATDTPWYTKEIKKGKVFVPNPEPFTLVTQDVPFIREAGKKPQAVFTGVVEAEGTSPVISFRIQTSEGQGTKFIKSHEQYKEFGKQYDIINKAELAKAGKWKVLKDEKDVMLLSEKVRKRNQETYVARIFQKHWDDLPHELQAEYMKYKKAPTTISRSEATNMLGASAARFLKRHNLPPDLVEALEPITQIAVNDFHGLIGAYSAIRTARAYDAISQNINACLKPSEFHAMAAKGKGLDPTKWVRVPNDKNRYFKLADKYVQRDVFLELESLVAPSGETYDITRKAMIKWKGFKTIWSPKVHVRNTVSNVMLNAVIGDHAMPMFGTGWQSYKHMAKVLADPTKAEHAALLKEMQEHNLFIGTFRSADLASLRPVTEEGVDSLIDYIAKGYKVTESKFARMYEAEEQWAKGAKYLYETRFLGVDPKKAAEDAMRSTFNYSDVTPFIKRTREAWWGAPFVTFTYKAIPALLESAVKYPWRIMAVEGVIYGANMAATNALGIQDEEWKRLNKQLPGFVSNGRYIPLPGRDSKGRIQWFDATYMLPWGLVYQMRQDYKDQGGSRVPFLGSMVMANPLVGTAAEIMHNEKYNGEPIVYSFDTAPMAGARIMAHVYQQAMPGLMIGGSDFMGMVDMIRDPNSPLGPTAAQLIAKNLGLNTYSRTEEQVNIGYLSGKKKQASEIKAELRKKVRRYPDRMDSETKKALKRLERLQGSMVD